MMNNRENEPPDFEPIGLVWTLISAMTDAMNLRHLRSELYDESVNPTPPSRLGNPQISDRAPFDRRFAQVGLQRPPVEVPAQYPRAKLDIRT